MSRPSTSLRCLSWSARSWLFIGFCSEYVVTRTTAVSRASSAAFLSRPERFLASLISRSGALALPLAARCCFTETPRSLNARPRARLW